MDCALINCALEINPIRWSITEKISPILITSAKTVTQFRIRRRRGMDYLIHKQNQGRKKESNGRIKKNLIAAKSRAVNNHLSTSRFESNADRSRLPIRKTLLRFNCDVCGYRCNSTSKLSYHMNSHTGEKPFKCEICSMSFSRPDTLDSHLKNQHLPPQFKCDFCPKMFKLKYIRDQHLNAHTGARPYEGEHCDAKFSFSNSLNHHRKKFHSPPSTTR